MYIYTIGATQNILYQRNQHQRLDTAEWGSFMFESIEFSLKDLNS